MNQALFMRRCFHLAKKAFRHTGNNPMVGAVLEYDGRIIGEGYHEIYGGPHAEVNCFRSVKNSDQHLIKNSTLYVSLEPCSFHGKTPACSSLIIEKKPAKVVVGCLDPNPKVAGSGVEALLQKSIPVEVGLLEHEAQNLIKKFRINIFENRPYIALKWAQSKHGYAGLSDQSIWFTNDFSKVKAHQLRSQFEGIMIGANTVLLDDPLLDNRYSVGPSPLKIVIDPRGRIPQTAKLFNHGRKCIIISKKDPSLHSLSPHTWITLSEESWNWNNIFHRIFELGITSVLVEGGPTLQSTIINAGLWDEAHVLSTNHSLTHGLRAPKVEGRRLEHITLADNDYVHIAKEEV